jgi:branched-chain amino acid transport system permease protein
VNYLYHLLVMICIYSVLGLSLNVVVGLCGRLSLCHAAFYGIGAFTTSLLVVHRGWEYFPAAAAAMSTSAAMALVIGWPALRLKDELFVLTTIAFQVIVFSVLYNWVEVTGGPYGLAGIPRPDFFGVRLTTPALFLALSSGVAAVVLAICWQLARSPYGRVLRAVRDDHVAATALGKNSFVLQLSAFVISAALAAIAGTLWAAWATYIDPTSFALDDSIFILAIVVIGGSGNMKGPVAGAVFMVLLPEILRFVGIPDRVGANVRQIIYGLLLILVMRFRREGLFGGYALE